MTYISNELSCCAMSDIANINDHDTPKRVVYQLCQFDTLIKDPGRMFIFTDVVRRKKGTRIGDALEAFILKNRFGQVIHTHPHRNGNSGNNVRCYIWTMTGPQQHRIRRWYTKELAKVEKETRDEGRQEDV